jgi:hypothetical protein
MGALREGEFGAGHSRNFPERVILDRRVYFLSG